MNKAGFLPSAGVMLSLNHKRYYKPLPLPLRPAALSFPHTRQSMVSPPPQRASRAARSILHNMPPLLPRESMCTTSVIPAHFQRPPLQTRGSASPISVTRLRLGSLSLRPAALPLGNLRAPITRTPIPGARKAYGQLFSRDFNPLDRSPITAHGLSLIAQFLCPLCQVMAYFDVFSANNNV